LDVPTSLEDSIIKEPSEKEAKFGKVKPEVPIHITLSNF
jgi:hypothetical protein